MSTGSRGLIAALVAAVVGAGIGFYVALWYKQAPATVKASAVAFAAPGKASANLELETVAAIGKQLDPGHPTWVSYLIRENGKWEHTTIYRVPAYSVVHVKIDQYDTPTGLRNPFLGEVQGTIGGTASYNGKPANSIPAEEASHTFAVPQLGVFVPLPGVPETAKNICEEGPCEPSTSAHQTVEFEFRTGAPGRYHWQCFVPCGAGYYFGNGGPMSTLGFMAGFLDVV